MSEESLGNMPVRPRVSNDVIGRVRLGRVAIVEVICTLCPCGYLNYSLLNDCPRQEPY